MRGFTDETAPHQVSLEAFGVAMRVCASTAELLAEIIPYLPPGWRERDDDGEAHRMGIVAQADGKFTVFEGERTVNADGNLTLSLTVLDTHMRMRVAINAPGLIFVHAGVVAHGDRAILLPGYSFAGKTTLVAALVRAGAVYYSDEFAVLNGEGLVHPYPKRLSLRRPDDTYQIEHEVGQLGGKAGDHPVPLALAVFTNYVEGANWNPRPMATGRAVLRMVENAVPARLRPEATLRAITRALHGATALEGERGEAEDVVDALLALAPAS